MDEIQKTDEYVEYIHTKYDRYLSKILGVIIIIIILMILAVCGMMMNTNGETYLSIYIAVYSILANLVLLIFIKNPSYSFIRKKKLKINGICRKPVGLLAITLILLSWSIYSSLPLSYQEFKEGTEIKEEQSEIEYGTVTADNIMIDEEKEPSSLISFSSGLCITYPYDEKGSKDTKYPEMKTKKTFIFPKGKEENIDFYQILFVDGTPTIGKGSGTYQFYRNAEEIYGEAYEEYKNGNTSRIIFDLFLFLTVLIPLGIISGIFLTGRHSLKKTVNYENMK